MALDTTVVFVIRLVAMLTSFPVMWRKQHLWNFSVPEDIFPILLLFFLLLLLLIFEHVCYILFVLFEKKIGNLGFDTC
jgi:hypothetical protein